MRNDFTDHDGCHALSEPPHSRVSASLTHSGDELMGLIFRRIHKQRTQGFQRLTRCTIRFFRLFVSLQDDHVRTEAGLNIGTEAFPGGSSDHQIATGHPSKRTQGERPYL